MAAIKFILNYAQVSKLSMVVISQGGAQILAGMTLIPDFYKQYVK